MIDFGKKSVEITAFSEEDAIAQYERIFNKKATESDKKNIILAFNLHRDKKIKEENERQNSNKQKPIHFYKYSSGEVEANIKRIEGIGWWPR